jgi:hypothetical protein
LLTPNGTGQVTISKSNTGFTTSIDNQGTAAGSSGLLITAGAVSGDNILLARQRSGTEIFAVKGDGNVLINTTTNAGFRLDVNGTARVTGNLIANSSVGIGSTSLGAHNIRMQKSITGGVIAYGMMIDSAIQSDVTSNAVGYSTNLSTQATAFTASNITHYQALQSTIGAGSTVTNQRGFVAGSNLTGATNNYGFFGQIASGTGRWNLYMLGTANNYLAGKLLIGSTTDVPSASVAITSTTQGFLPPRMTSAQRTAIASPAEGLLVIQTDGVQGLYIYINATWRAVTMTTI